MNLKDVYLANYSGENGCYFLCPYTGKLIQAFNHGIRGNDSYEGIVYPALTIVRILKEDGDKVFVAMAKAKYNGYEDPVVEVIYAEALANHKMMKIEDALFGIVPIFKKVYDESNWDGVNKRLKQEAREKYNIYPERDSLEVKHYGNEGAPVNVYYESPHIAIVEQNLTNNYHFNPYFIANEIPEGTASNYNTLPNYDIDEVPEDLPIKDILEDIDALCLITNDEYIEGAINKKLLEIKDEIKKLNEDKKENLKELFNEFRNKSSVVGKHIDYKKLEKHLKDKKQDLLELKKQFNNKEKTNTKRR